MSKITAERMAEELRAWFYTIYTSLLEHKEGPVVEFWFVRGGCALVGTVTHVDKYNTYDVRATLTGPHGFPADVVHSPITAGGRVNNVFIAVEGKDLVGTVEDAVKSARKIVSAASNQPESYFAPRLPQRLP